MDRLYIDEMMSGDRQEGVYRISGFSVQQDRAGNDYASFTIHDCSGSMPVKMFEVGVTSSVMDRDDLEEGGLAWLNLQVKEYKGELTGSATMIRKATSQDNYVLEDLVETAPEQELDMYEELLSMADSFAWPDLSKVVHKALEGRKDILLSIPTGKRMHHNVYGGLLYHMIRMARCAKAVASVYPEVDGDLLCAGAIIHDLGKIDEFVLEKDTSTVLAYTPEADLFSHNILGILYLKDICESVDADPEVFRLLGHMVESHHGAPERGSAVVPKFMEAYLLSCLDEIDSRIWIFEKEYGKLEPGSTSPRRIDSLGHGIYFPKYYEKQDDES